ncbi:MAG: DUF58 domain-containing protein [Planctomycetes bacterium]|nr:DUF58 domain-containing protein [Planctomycetota bacterium]
MIPKEILRKVRQIEIRTNRVVDALIAGEYHSAFKGRGMEFEEVREYQPGDEVRTIDWNVTARTGHPFVKTFREERELTVMLLVDVSPSERFGTGPQQKSELAAEFGALVAFAAIRNNDKAGLILFTDGIEKYVPPKKGRKHALRVIRELLAFRPVSSGTDLRAALEFLGRVQRRRCVAFIVSDFIAAGFERDLAAVAHRHDLIAVRTADPREAEIPDAGLIALEDAETGEVVVVDTASRNVRRLFESGGGEARATQDELLKSLAVDSLGIWTGRPYIKELSSFFRMREKRMAR